MHHNYHDLVTSSAALVGTRNSYGSTMKIDPTTHRTMSERSYHGTYISLPLVRPDFPIDLVVITNVLGVSLYKYYLR